MRRSAAGPAFVLALTAATVAAQLAGSGGAPRVVVTLVFLAVGPGLPFTPQLPGEGAARAAIAVALSLSIEAAVTTGLLAAGAYNPAVVLALLAAVATGGSVLELARRAAQADDASIQLHRSERV